MDAKELDRRRPVWRALSQVFLDTETRWFFPRIAQVLAESGYTREELDAIWRYEVAPECLGNLFQTAGEWDSIRMDEAALILHAERKPGILVRGLRRVPLLVVSGQYQQLLQLREALLRRSPELRPQLVAAWSAFALIYIEAEPRRGVGRVRNGGGIPGTGLTREQCEATFAQDFRPVYARLLLRDERRAEEERARRVSDFIARAFA
ncbi:MAG TPA: hypothetical protein VK843_03385 [Planctomycetota bacterium]|nr:hypothetical protein [Planctomycetota bacterium]